MEPEAVAEGVRGGGAGEEEVEAGGEVFDALEAGGGSEGEEVDAAESVGGEVEEEDCGCGRHLHARGSGTRGLCACRMALRWVGVPFG